MRSARAWARAFFTILVWAAMVSGPAQAGCSHYVEKSARAWSVEFSLAALDDAGAPTDEAERTRIATRSFPGRRINPLP
jgi:hypothetical protein